MSAWLGQPQISSYQGFNLNDLPLNYAYVIANTTLDNVGVYSVDANCVNCPYERQKSLHRLEAASWQVETSRRSSWRIMNTATRKSFPQNFKGGLLCELDSPFGEFGVYKLDIGFCELTEVVPAVNTYLPLLLCVILLLATGVFYWAMKLLINYVRKPNLQNGDGICLSFRTDSRKLLSLYVLRGLLLSLIIFFTTGAGGYTSLTADFGGLSPAHTMFHLLIWSIGMKIPITIRKAIEREQTKCSVFGGIVKRSFVLMCVGVMIESTRKHNSHNFTALWCPMQVMGLAYFFTSTAYLLTEQKFELKSKNVFCKSLSNFMHLLWCWIFAIFLMSMQINLMIMLLSFNCQANAAINGDEYHRIEVANNNCNTDVSHLSNNILLGEASQVVYINSYYGFSKGAMGVLTAVIYCLMGLSAGAVYNDYETHADKLKLWIISSITLLVFGIGIGALSVILMFNLWPLVTIFFSTSSVYIALSAIYAIVEYWQITKMSLLKILGVASFFILPAHLLFSSSEPFSFHIYFRSHLMFLGQNVWILFLWSVIAVIVVGRGMRISM